MHFSSTKKHEDSIEWENQTQDWRRPCFSYRESRGTIFPCLLKKVTRSSKRKKATSSGTQSNSVQDLHSSFGQVSNSRRLTSHTESSWEEASHRHGSSMCLTVPRSALSSSSHGTCRKNTQEQQELTWDATQKIEQVKVKWIDQVRNYNA